MNCQNQHLIDHNYILHIEKEIEFPYQIVDHDYALPIIKKEDYDEDILDEDVPDEDVPDKYVPDKIIVNEPKVYRILPGVQRNTKIYLDDIGYKYYKKKLLISKITLICERQRNRSRPMCHGTAYINKDETDNRITIGTPHNHEPQLIDMNVPLLRDALGERCLDPIRTQSVRSIYNSEIIR